MRPMLAFTVFERGRPQLVVLDGPKAIAGEHVATADDTGLADSNGAETAPGLIDRLIADPRDRLAGFGRPRES